MLKNYLDNWEKTFFSIWVGRAFCLLGSELAQFSLIWYLTERTDSPTVLAAASFVTLLPHVFLPLINQAFISRWNQQGVM
ncbi:MAG: MFS transporter, partial [Anaerolineaceae bacterium]|nr:MFS transporter [Anaerolineaceae bacterium]